MNVHKEKDVLSNAWNAKEKNLKFIENGKSNLILFFMLYLAQRIILAKRRIGSFVLFSRKNIEDGWMESREYFEPNQTSTMKLFCETTKELSAVN